MYRNQKKIKISFESLAREANLFLKPDGLPLTFAGYKETMYNYFSMHDHDILDVHNNLVECSLWAKHFSEIEALLGIYEEKYLLSVDWYRALEDYANPSAELEALYQEELRKHKMTKQLRKQVHNQKKFFEKAANHCLFLYKKAKKAYSTYGDK